MCNANSYLNMLWMDRLSKIDSIVQWVGGKDKFAINYDVDINIWVLIRKAWGLVGSLM